MTRINRDPFAREELHREVVKSKHQPMRCTWCGTLGYRLFRYRVETDGGRKFPDNKLFCSKSCRRSYYT